MAKKPEFEQYKIRMPVGLKAQIQGAAESSARSMSAEIIFRLENSFFAESPLGRAAKEFHEEWDHIEETLAKYASDVRFAISARAYQRIKLMDKPSDVDLARLSAIVEKYGEPPMPFGIDPDVHMSSEQRRRIMRQVKSDMIAEGQRQLKAKPKKTK